VTLRSHLNRTSVVDHTCAKIIIQLLNVRDIKSDLGIAEWTILNIFVHASTVFSMRSCTVLDCL
jgi:hypothetical protein